MRDQLALFGMGNDARPLPEIIASGGSGWSEFKLQYHDVDGKRYYAVQDWIAGVSGSDTPRRVWTDLKARYSDGKVREVKRGRKPISPEKAEHVQKQLARLAVQLKYHASNGKNYTMDFATDEGLYLITQLIEAESEVRNHILAYLAKAGVALDEMRRDPGIALDAGVAGYARRGKTAEWIAQRTKGKNARTDFTEVARDTHVFNRPDYGRLTDVTYEEVLGAAKAEISAALKLTKAQTDQFRDQLGKLAIQAIDAAETGAAMKMRETGDTLTTPEQIAIVKHCARLVAPSFWALAQYTNTDLITGRNALKAGVR